MNYKKILVLLLSFISINISAQNQSKWQFAIEAGINYSNSSEDTKPLKKECPILPKIGINVGYALSSKLSIESGVSYGQKGLKSKGNTEQIKASVELKQDVIQIPVLAVYKIKLLNKLQIGAGAGAYYAYGIGGKTKASGIVGGQPINKKVNTFDSILKKNDTGLNFKILSEYQHLTLNLVYELGLINIGKSNVMGNNLDYKNRVISTTLGYRF